MATIRKRLAADGTSRWQAQIRRTGCRPLVKTFSRKSDADLWVRETERGFDLGDVRAWLIEENLTVGELVDHYLEEGVTVTRGDRRVAASDRRNRARQLSWWKSRLGRLHVSRVTPALVARELSDLGKIGPAGRPVAPASRNRYLSALSTVFTWAVRQQRAGLSRNPLVGAALRSQETRGLDRVLSTGEQKALIAAAETDEHPRIGLWILLALATGARQGELGRLKWSDIKMVKKTAGSPAYGVLTFYRTKNSDPKMVVLAEERALETLRRVSRQRGRGRDLILATAEIAATTRQVTFPKGAWARVRRNAGLDDSGVVFHTLRHTHASLLLQGGCSLAEIGQGLGHRSPISTQRYVHLAEEHARAIAARLTSVVDW